MKRHLTASGPLRTALLLALGFLVINRLLAVNIIPVITNDSVGYLSHANDAWADGFVWGGYRQVGYPLLLVATDTAGSFLHIEPVLLTAAIQRLLLGLGIAYAVWLFRWWSLPLVVIATAPDIVAYTNLILTEGAAIPLSILYGTLLAHLVLNRHPGSFPHASSLPFGILGDRAGAPARRALLVVASLVVLALTLVKYQAIALVFPLCALLWMDFRDESRRRFVIVLGVSLAGVLTVVSSLMALENRSEYDDLFPISRGIRNGYWGTFQLVFNLNPENRENPALTTYYADGNIFDFIREVEGTIEDYPTQRAVFENAITLMLHEAGMDKRQEQLRATWGAMRGGRFDDIRGIVALIRTSSTDSAEATIHKNSFSTARGIDQYVAGYNGGQKIEPVLTAALFHSGLTLSARSMIVWTGPLTLIVLLAALALFQGIRLFAAAGVLGALMVFGLVGLLLVDNYRYVIVTHMYLIPIATTAAIIGWHHVASAMIGPRRGILPTQSTHGR